MYPENVMDKFQYRWKPIIIALELQQHTSIFWMDSSVVHKENMEELLASFRDNCSSPLMCQFYPWVSLDHGGHSVFATTHIKV